MDQQQSLRNKLEILWWVITVIILGVILYPILSKIENYQFLVPNIIFVLVFITFTRFIFQLKHTFLGKRQKLKAFVMLISLPLTAYIIQSLHNFQSYIDENGIGELLKELPIEQQNSLGEFIKTEYIFFGVGALIAIVVLFFRLVISIWRFRNKGTI